MLPGIEMPHVVPEYFQVLEFQSLLREKNLPGVGLATFDRHGPRAMPGQFDCVKTFEASQVKHTKFGQRLARDVRNDLDNPLQLNLVANDARLNGVEIVRELNIMRGPWAIALDDLLPPLPDPFNVHSLFRQLESHHLSFHRWPLQLVIFPA